MSISIIKEEPSHLDGNDQSLSALNSGTDKYNMNSQKSKVMSNMEDLTTFVLKNTRNYTRDQMREQIGDELPEVLSRNARQFFVRTKSKDDKDGSGTMLGEFNLENLFDICTTEEEKSMNENKHTDIMDQQKAKKLRMMYGYRHSNFILYQNKKPKNTSRFTQAKNDQ